MEEKNVVPISESRLFSLILWNFSILCHVRVFGKKNKNFTTTMAGFPSTDSQRGVSLM